MSSHMQSQSVTCAFCGKTCKPHRERKKNIVIYRCGTCRSVIAAYALKFEKELKFGSQFRKYPIGSYRPELPKYMRKAD